MPRSFILGSLIFLSACSYQSEEQRLRNSGAISHQGEYSQCVNRGGKSYVGSGAGQASDPIGLAMEAAAGYTFFMLSQQSCAARY